MIDEVRFYNRALQPADVELLWNEGKISTVLKPELQQISKNLFEIYPNPAKDFFNVSTESKYQKIYFYRSDGSKILSIDNQQTSTTVFVTEWEPRIYLAKTNDGKTAKIVIQ